MGFKYSVVNCTFKKLMCKPHDDIFALSYRLQSDI